MSNSAVFGSNWLESQLTESLGASEVSNLVRLSGGANRETWSFDAKVQESHHSLIMQIDRDGMDRLNGTCERESRILRIAKQNGVPVPTVILSGRSDGHGSRSFSITERMQGETIARKILRDAEERFNMERYKDRLDHWMWKSPNFKHKSDDRTS